MGFPREKEVPRVQLVIAQKFDNRAVEIVRAGFYRGVQTALPRPYSAENELDCNLEFLDRIDGGSKNDAIKELLIDTDPIQKVLGLIRRPPLTANSVRPPYLRC